MNLELLVYKVRQNYNLDISLFERLINNGFEYAKLLEQHRMRPEISRIVKNEFYPDIQDHFSVQRYTYSILKTESFLK